MSAAPAGEPGTGRGAAWMREDVAGGFLERRRRILPFIDVQEDLAVRVLRRHGTAVGRFLDLGGGDGALTELLLSEWPDARAVLVDQSRPMLERAGVRLSRFAGRWEAAEADLADAGWPECVQAGGYDAAVSAFAIHHLTGAEKRQLFTAVLGLLAPGALFLNIDYVTVTGPLRGIFEEQMAINLTRSERERGGQRSEEEIAAELALAFDCDDEDHPDRAEDQVAWLTAAGFTEAEIHFKWGEVALYGGARPA